MPYLDQNAGNTPVAGVYAVAAALAFDDDGGGAAGVYTASVAVPAGATLLDVIIDGIALDYGDTVDIGMPLSEGRVIPVIVKTLAFAREAGR